MSRKVILPAVIIACLVAFFTWRVIRPMNIFTVSKAFERPVSTKLAPEMFGTLSAKECGECHKEIYNDWITSMHSKAWTEPYFQVDWKFDRSAQVCKNCHIPLDRQQEHLVTGFYDSAKWDPILEPNPDFDADLQLEGVTCAGCHLRNGKILGPHDSGNAPHPVKKLDNGNQICVRCHVVGGDRWDTFLKMPPCGTVAEIRITQGKSPEHEIPPIDTKSLKCVNCHMPYGMQEVVAGAEKQKVRRHLWRGGHDPAMVKSGLSVKLEKMSEPSSNKQIYKLTLTNTGAEHFLPTGTPDRHLTALFRLLGQNGKIIKEQNHILKRTVLWRPFIVDLWDTRLRRGKPREYLFEFTTSDDSAPITLEATVRYHLLDEQRRKRIGYKPKEPISYEVFRKVEKIK